MSLAPGEQRTLSEIESRLRRSDPELAAMFERLDGDGIGQRSPLAGPPRCAQGLGVRSVVVLIAICALFVGCLAIALVAASDAGTRLNVPSQVTSKIVWPYLAPH